MNWCETIPLLDHRKPEGRYTLKQYKHINYFGRAVVWNHCLESELTTIMAASCCVNVFPWLCRKFLIEKSRSVSR